MNSTRYHRTFWLLRIKGIKVAPKRQSGFLGNCVYLPRTRQFNYLGCNLKRNE